MLFVSRFAPFYAAFSTILPCVLHQNALYFAPKRTAFSGILHHILPKIAPNLVLMAVVYNKYSFCCIRGLTRFCPKINSRENRFFAARLAIGDENGTHNVKIYAEKRTKRGWRVDWLSRLQVGLVTSLRHHKLISWRINRLQGGASTTSLRVENTLREILLSFCSRG